jgi:hypothetical protein
MIIIKWEINIKGNRFPYLSQGHSLLLQVHLSTRLHKDNNQNRKILIQKEANHKIQGNLVEVDKRNRKNAQVHS